MEIQLINKSNFNEKFNLKYVQFFILFLVIFNSSCTPPTIEQRVEKLMKCKEKNKRQELASELADFINIHPIELIIGLYTNNDFAKQALEDMLARYASLINSGKPELQVGAIKCVDYIINPIGQKSNLSNNSKIELIVYGLQIEDLGGDFHNILISSAKLHGKEALITLVNSWYKNKQSKGLLLAISAFEYESIELLINQIGMDKNAEELLAHIGEPAVKTLLSKMKSDDQKIRFAAADILVQMVKFNPGAVMELTQAIDNNSIGIIAENYPFYIRMGLSGTEELLIKALDSDFSNGMCVDYLNCGNSILESGGKEVAEKHGYFVLPGFGGNYGPKWGSEN